MQKETQDKYIYTEEEVRNISSMNDEEWRIKRSEVYQEEQPFDLVAREKGLRDFHSVVKKMGLNVWLTGGAILGAVRDDDFIPWDDDMDMDMLEEEFVPVMHEFNKRLIESGFITRFTDTKKFPKISCFKYGNKYAIGGTVLKGKWRVRPNLKYPARFFEDSETVVFKGMDFLQPTPVEEYLEFCYKDWKTPVDSDVSEEYEHAHRFRDQDVTSKALRKVKSIVKSIIGRK